ncbi:CoA ester lyase [Sphingomonas sp. LaA6.9]|uniref:HpcH/HpaI aldolase/citrate lyase family protein n=1 Tax=Sphingomonas sp. LaA6.9 TaxID=2919914 RepID=UPI001F503238|nr:CoA ester lyase [Sphingomonas sp. LaA6.9]MCJ8157385.1 CoA ester lyase [Sphingomonas sp. LaA6.9]
MNAAIGLSSMLFVPGSKPERYGKALASDADVVCVDLEDSVPESGKVEARAAAIAAIAQGDQRLILRINGVATRAGLEDLLALADAEALPPLLFVPMVESAAQVAIVTSVLGDRAPGIVPLIETVKGLNAAQEIASATGVVAMMFGGGDLSAELGVELAWEPLRSARGAFVMACAGAGIPAIDVPFIVLDDAEGLCAEAEAAKALGFTGKAAIHPAQVDTINAVFRPTAEQIAEAEEAQRVFDAAGGAAVRFNGRMLEAPIMRRYQRILAMRSKQDA